MAIEERLTPPTRADESATPRGVGASSWLRGLVDLPREHGFEPLSVEGTLPPTLRGTYYRNGPGRFVVGRERYAHWFDGDGVVAAVRIEDGRAYGASRFVLTEGLLRERRANKRLFGSWGTGMARPLRELFLNDRKNPVNTNVILYQGELLALCEGGKPYVLSPDDLTTRQETDLGVISQAFSAHYHRVPSRRATYNFGLAVGTKSTVELYELPDRGAPRRLTSFQIDGMRMSHDFVVTEHHAVFVFAPWYASIWRVVAKREGFASSGTWHPERGTEIVVVSLDEPSSIRRFVVDAFYLAHTGNGFEDNGQVVFEYTHYNDLDDLEGYVSSVASGRVRRSLASSLRRARLDPHSGAFSIETVVDQPIEMPRVAPRMEQTARHRFVYCAGFRHPAEAGETAWNTVWKFDLERGTRESYAAGDDRYVSEPIFIPRSQSPDTAEDDGHVITLVLDAEKNTSALEVLDARDLERGPVARCAFDHVIPLGFHGIWTELTTT
jgi:carotenoid cleavage dioxygenase-like enzyme